jgi:polysaccharide export outer membrane protein
MIYTINLRDPAGYFLASSFEMRNKDILYASNAFSVESTKFMTWLTTVNTPGAHHQRHPRPMA